MIKDNFIEIFLMRKAKKEKIAFHVPVPRYTVKCFFVCAILRLIIKSKTGRCKTENILDALKWVSTLVRLYEVIVHLPQTLLKVHWNMCSLILIIPRSTYCSRCCVNVLKRALSIGRNVFKILKVNTVRIPFRSSSQCCPNIVNEYVYL